MTTRQADTMVQERPAVEWPTAILAAGIYIAWLAVTYAYTVLPIWIVAPVGALLVTLHSSLQHEVLHGHPTRWRTVNKLVGIVPLNLWLPYLRYRQTHLLHHIDDRLTDPLDDPESFYWTEEHWRRIGAVGRFLVSVQTTLAGRLLVGPFWSIGRFLVEETRRVIAGAPGARAIWAEHLAWCVPVVLWVTVVCGMPLWLYVLSIVVPGTAVMLIRSFAEHKAVPSTKERVAIVENARLLGPLFLYNNLHALHHEAPTVPWYRYPAWYRDNRERLIAENGGLVYDSYLDVARRYMFRSHDGPRHPTDRVPLPVAAE
jgi:fatty acid desaturase